MENGLQSINLMPFTLSERADYVAQVVDEFNNLPEGEQQKLFIHLKTIIETLEAVYKHDDVRHAITSRIDGNTKSIENSYGTIQVANGATYEYKHCPTWVSLNEKLKAHENKMKAITSEMVDTETGEIIVPAIKKPNERITVKTK